MSTMLSAHSVADSPQFGWGSQRLLFALVFLLALASFSASQAVPGAIRVGETLMAEHLVTKVASDYPPLARQARIQGPVVLRVKINKSKDVENMKFVNGDPCSRPPPWMP